MDPETLKLYYHSRDKNCVGVLIRMCFFLNKKKIQSHTSDLFMESISDRVNQIFRLVDSIISLGGKMLASTSMDHHRSVRLVAS
jgi:hypothetical protein